MIVPDRVPNKSADSISRVSDGVHAYIPEQLKVNDLLYFTIKVEYDYNNKYIVTMWLLWRLYPTIVQKYIRVSTSLALTVAQNWYTLVQ